MYNSKEQRFINDATAKAIVRAVMPIAPVALEERLHRKLSAQTTDFAGMQIACNTGAARQQAMTTSG